MAGSRASGRAPSAVLVVGILVGLLAAAVRASGTFSTGDGMYALTWTTTATTITFTVSGAVGSGWLGVGIATAPFMAGADMYLAYVSGATATVVDSSALGESMPPSDVSQGGTSNVASVSGSVVRLKGGGRTLHAERSCGLALALTNAPFSRSRAGPGLT